MVKVFYHNDPDGWCSAFWVRKYLESQKIEFCADDFIEMNYDRKFPMDKVQLGEQVSMVDFCLNDPEQMVQLAANCYFTWIDLHKSAIEKMSTYMSNYTFRGIRYDGIAACALTWAYFHFKFYKPEPERLNGQLGFSLNATETLNLAPLFTQYIHLWDTWQWKTHDCSGGIEAFITYLMSVDCNPLSDMWDDFEFDGSGDSQTLNFIIKGQSMIAFRNGYAQGLCSSIGKTIEFEGFRCFVCNMGHVSSEWFKSVSDFDIMMPFYYNAQTEQFCFSLYTTKDIDVSKIAVKYGGGGHCGAAGFQSKTLPWLDIC